MAPKLVHLPNGQTFTVTAVFGGLFFKANELNVHHAVFPPGWTIILQSEDEDDDHVNADNDDGAEEQTLKRHHVHRYRQPTLTHDYLFISSISNPSSSDFKPATSPTRQIALSLWVSLWWYFHQVWHKSRIYGRSHMLTFAQVSPEPTLDCWCQSESPGGR